MKRKRSSDPEYDYSPVGYARRCAIRVLDDYGCSTEEIVAMFDVSKATFHRYDLDVRLIRRPALGASRTPMSPQDAREIAVIALIRSEEYGASVIAEALGISPSTVYRQRKAFADRLGEKSWAELRQMHRYLKHRLQDAQTPHRKRAEARLSEVCVRRRGSSSRFSS